MVHEFDGEKYRKASAHQQQWGAGLIATLEFCGQESVLDLGCGDGRLTAELAARVPQGRVVGIDASQGMITTAGKYYDLPNVSFELLDILELSWEDEFDIVFSNAALHWVLEHEPVLAAVYRALHVGGKARFNFAGQGNCANFFSVVREIIRSERFAPFFIDFSWPWYMPGVAEYEALVTQAGFSATRVWLDIADRVFPDKESIVGWIEQPSIVPFLEYLPDGERDDFTAAVVAQVLARCDQGDGTYFETFRRLNLLAVK